MKNFEKLIKKYFILIIILLPLRKMGVFFIMVFGQEFLLDYFGTFEEYEQGYPLLLDKVEMLNVYLINLIIAIIVLIDIKPRGKLIGIPMLTFLTPIFGLVLFFIQKFYSLNRLSLNHEQAH